MNSPELPKPRPLVIVVATIAALLAFAANSLLCREALGKQLIDATSFTMIRLVAGTIMLGVISAVIHRSDDRWRRAGNWLSGIALFVYAWAFSLAYRSLTAETGALVLFGCVQVTILTWGIIRGERLSRWQWLGFIMAMAGLLYLVSPGLSAPPLGGAVCMAIAGSAWGVYSVRGRGHKQPVAANAGNFAIAMCLALIVSLLDPGSLRISEPRGVLLAVISGAITSGLGYAIWYTALTGLTATRAAIVQLMVPIITALAAVMFLGGSLSLRLITAGLLILGGVALVVLERRK
ncbi:MAG TPA: DMT family transporter [Pirellulaceae bacterium]|nr:DMT family transporter [Pirellulaceae bacterium]